MKSAKQIRLGLAGIIMALAISGAHSAERAPRPARDRPPNVVIILTDDQGYADIGAQGAEGFQTPHLDRLAREGMRFTDFHVAAPVCSASRAALLTGCYPQRVGIPAVVSANATYGINPDEKLLPEILRERGYSTAVFGKWHLGHHHPTLPLQNGFDEFFGSQGSNDMGPGRPTLEQRRLGKAGVRLLEGNDIIEIDPDQRLLTRRYTERAVDFIHRKRDRPFFLYVPHNMPHTPLFASDAFAGGSKRGLYGDVIEEIDESVGQILEALSTHGLERHTLVMFTSDNGPWLIFGDHGGSAKPLRGGKKQVWEGGLRVPCIMRWTGEIPADSVCRELATTMDILPTITGLVGGRLPGHGTDGQDIWPLLSGQADARSPHDAFYYYWQYELHAVRSGDWKLILPHTDAQAPDPHGIGNGGIRGAVRKEKVDLALFDLKADPGEKLDRSKQRPEIVRRLQKLAEQARRDLGDDLTDRKGANRRPPWRSKKTKSKPKTEAR